ncbi:hypothetical protein RDMS_01640 [Deinococcus sp. RL]|uniref:phage terminase large subunit n=1 Tax=Deinococcus sp. RL TaxID=1489678 RepID=UPI0004D3446B|nr:phage terminase large subunit [Deinococcus sp. RL]KEF35484.1 hypothetical protein RDMS_01640 [Deinococcus sp. RL]
MPTSLPLPPNQPPSVRSSLTALSNFQAPARARPTEPPATPDLLTYWQARYPRYQLAPHIELMLRELNDLGDGEALIITMPPRHSKSESVKAWLEWSLGQHPDSEAILASYAVDLARRHSRSIRNEIAFGEAFKRHFPGVTLAPDSAAATDWALSQGGRFKAAGVGVGITGMGARFGVIDDPFKDRKQAESEVVREGVWDWFTSAFLTRLTPDARVIVMHTRWHEDDLVGRIQQRLSDGETDELGGLTWRVLNLPAFAEEDDLLGRPEGAPLWPERYDARRLEGIRDANPYEFAALYQQRPTNRGGTVFLDSVGTYDTPLTGRTFITVDTASSKRETADYSVLTAWATQGTGGTARADVLECTRRRMSITEFLAAARELQGRYGVPLHIEDAGLAKPIIQFLQSEGLSVVPVKVSGDKFTRAQPYAAAWNGGRVRLPASAPWLGAFKAEHLAFTGTPTDKHDDQVDTGSLLWQLLQNPAPKLKSHIWQT